MQRRIVFLTLVLSVGCGGPAVVASRDVAQPRSTPVSDADSSTPATERSVEIGAAEPGATDAVHVLVVVVDRERCTGSAVQRATCPATGVEGLGVELRDSTGARASGVTSTGGRATLTLAAMEPSDVAPDLVVALEDGSTWPAADYVRAVAALRAREAARRAETAPRPRAVGELRVAGGLTITGATRSRASVECGQLGGTWARTDAGDVCTLDTDQAVSLEFDGDVLRELSLATTVPSAMRARSMLAAMQELAAHYGPADGTDGPAHPDEVHQARWSLVDSAGVNWRASLLTSSSGLVVRYTRTSA